MAKDPTTDTAADQATDTADNSVADTGPEQDSDTPDTPAKQTGGCSSFDYNESPEDRTAREAKYTRAEALRMATAPGIHEAKEPIGAVLARAEAYVAYMETGATSIV